jgi:hypothetical protein
MEKISKNHRSFKIKTRAINLVNARIDILTKMMVIRQDFKGNCFTITSKAHAPYEFKNQPSDTDSLAVAN